MSSDTKHIAALVFTKKKSADDIMFLGILHLVFANFGLKLQREWT